VNHLRLLECSSPPPSQPRSASLAPALPPNGAIPSEIDLQLGKLGQRAVDGDRDALNALYAAYLPRLDNWVRRAHRSCYRTNADPVIEPDDIVQQAYLVFADLMRSWSGLGSLSAFLIAYFPWRLSDAVRRMSDAHVRRSLDGLPSTLLIDGTVAADEAVALLQTLAGDLPDRQGQVLLLRIRDGLTWDEIARCVGMDRRTVLRDWSRILNQLRSSLIPGV
jgi:RNA polymerase sigma factor (sigma-70 family)